MTIAVVCECGKRGVVPDEAAGHQGECSFCGRLIAIPLATIDTPPQSGGIATEAGESQPPRQCPSCGVILASEAVLCVNCGFDYRTGTRLDGASARVRKPGRTSRHEGSSPRARKPASAMKALFLVLALA